MVTRRANATPSKDFLKNDASQQVIENTKRRTDGRMRKLIQDLCDFCLKPKYIKRHQLGWRLRGYKFGCNYCHRDGKFKWKSEGSDQKVLPMFGSNVRKLS